MKALPAPLDQHSSQRQLIKKSDQEENPKAPCKQFCITLGGNLLENTGQFVSTTLWVGISYLQEPFSCFSGGYPLLLVLEGLASAICAVPFSYAAYRVMGGTSFDAKKQIKMDFAITFVLDGTFQLYSDLVVCFYRRGRFTFWAEPSYENPELGISLGVYFVGTGLLNFAITELLARRIGTTKAETLNRIKNSAVMWLLYVWFYCMDSWTPNYYQSPANARDKAEDSLVTGLGVALPALAFDLLVNIAVLLKESYCKKRPRQEAPKPKNVAMSPLKDPSTYQATTQSAKLETQEEEDEEVLPVPPVKSSCCSKIQQYIRSCCNSIQSQLRFFSKPTSLQNPVVPASAPISYQNV